jgi:hypothetical protein
MKKFAGYTTILIGGIAIPQLSAEPCSNFTCTDPIAS